MVVGASIALATKRPAFDGVAVGETHRGGAPVPDDDLLDVGVGDDIAPPHATITRRSASVKLADPPTGRVNSITLAKISGNTMPAPGTLSVVMTCM